jgi:hypothetical protein
MRVLEVEVGYDGLAEVTWLASSCAVTNSLDAGLLRTVGTAINSAAVLDAVSNYRTLTVRTAGSHGVDRALEAVERHGLVSLRDAEGLIVIIAADVTGCHQILLEVSFASFIRQPLVAFSG